MIRDWKPGNGGWLFLLVGAGLFLVWLLGFDGQGLPTSITAVSRPIVTIDLEQPRANTVLPAPQGGLIIRQSFVPRWDGLREVELVLARNGEPDEGENGRLHLTLFDDADTLIAEQQLTSRNLTHNQTVSLRFAPQKRSAGRRYTLQISGSGDNRVTVWGYSLDVYETGKVWLDGGALATNVPSTDAQDLRFITRTQLTGSDALISLGTMLWKNGAIMLLALFFLPLPGVLLLLLGSEWAGWRGAMREHFDQRYSAPSRPYGDGYVWWGMALALGTAVWPLIWLGLTLLGGRWRGWSLWLVFIIGWLFAIFLWAKNGRRVAGCQRLFGGWRDTFAHLLPRSPAPLLFLLIFATRLLAVRDLSFPPWVDASRHGLITAVMTHSGQMPGSYEPFLPVDTPLYHFGFHALSASLELMTGWPINRLLLFLGQVIQGVLPLTVYTAVVLMTRRRRAGLLAAFLVGIPFFFPGYYVTWGRLTQLTAMVVMPVLLALTWLLIRGGRGWRRHWWLVGLLAAGLFLIHLRVFIYFLPFAAVVWLLSWGRNGRYLAAASGLALLLISPRMVQLATHTSPAKLTRNPISGYNAFPVNYVQTGWEEQILWLAAALLPFVLIAGWRRRRWSWLPLALVGWTAVAFILVAGKRWGLPTLSMVNVNSLYITVFLPLAIFLGVIGDQLWRWQRQWLRTLRWGAQIAAGGVLMAAALFGARQQISILNTQTLLARQADVAGLAWVNEHVPPTAVIGISSWKWLGETWAGSDGGAWLLPLTGRMTTTPPIDHTYNVDLFQFVREFNTAATAVTDWSDPAQADWLRQQGVSAIFIGQRGGYFDPVALTRNPKMALVYGRDGVFIFEIKD